MCIVLEQSHDSETQITFFMFFDTSLQNVKSREFFWIF